MKLRGAGAAATRATSAVVKARMYFMFDV